MRERVGGHLTGWGRGRMMRMIILSVVTSTTALTMSVSSSFRGEISTSRRASSSHQSSSRVISITQEDDVDRLAVVRRAEQELTSYG